MAGTYLTDQQVRLYMKLRQEGSTQICASAKSGFSERSGRRIDQGAHFSQQVDADSPRHWRTRADPLESVWDSELVPLLKVNPELLPVTLLDYLCERYPQRFDHRISRTLQRRVKAWKLQHGPAKEEIHALARDIKMGKRGRVSQRDWREQSHSCSCLTLVMACIIYWQAREINRVIQDHTFESDDIDLSLIKHISPIAWENIILYGDYILNRAKVRV